MAAILPHSRCLNLNLKQVVAFSRQLQLCSSRNADARNAVQKYGWEYLVRQEKSGRPLSPHLNIYKPQLTWMLSGLHRITGCIMAGTLLVGGIAFAITPVDFTTFIEFARGLNMPTPVTAIFKFIVAFPLVFHSLNGIRFMGFDLAKGTDIKSVYRSGWLTLGVSALIALAIVIDNARTKKTIKY
uniref:Succinate dehydrogenase cytochrome b560 subunit, mitochondrial n=1 Tax=Panagrolaimus sp. ES5 TaxID=591445 RepID=A0AC34GSA8_9BILA